MRTKSESRLVFLLNVAQRRLQRWMAAQTDASGVTAAQSGCCLSSVSATVC